MKIIMHLYQQIVEKPVSLNIKYKCTMAMGAGRVRQDFYLEYLIGMRTNETQRNEQKQLVNTFLNTKFQ